MTFLTGVSASDMVAALEQAGLRPTRPRNALIEQIAEWSTVGKDFTSEELWHATQDRAPWIGRATAFRTVELLTALGFLDRVTFADGGERYHLVHPGTHHHHLTCAECHRVVSIDACLPEELLAERRTPVRICYLWPSSRALWALSQLPGAPCGNQSAGRNDLVPQRTYTEHEGSCHQGQGRANSTAGICEERQ